MSWTFDGVDDQLPAGSEIWGNIFSVSAWFNPTTLGQSSQGRIVEHGVASGPRFSISMSNTPVVNSLRIKVGRGTDGIWDTLPNAIAFGLWQHLVVTYDGSVASNHILAYYNGQPLTLTVASNPAGTIQSDNQVVYIGNAGNVTRTFKGMIAEVGVWPYVLSPAAVQNVYTRGVFAEPNIRLYWPCDGNSGNAAGRQQFPSGGGSLTLVGALPGEHPWRPAGR